MRANRRRMAYALGVNYASMVSAAIALNLIPVFLTTLSVDLGGPGGLTPEQLGRIGSVNFMGVLAGILLATPLVGRLGAKPMAVGANLLIGAALVALAAVAGYPGLLVAVFFMGFGAGIFDVVLNPIVCALQPQRRASVINWLHAFSSIGAVGAVLVGAMALRQEVGWRAISLWIAAAPVLVGLGFLAMKAPPLVAEGHRRTSLPQLCRQPYFLAAVALMLLVGGTELAVVFWLPAYVETALGFDKWTGGMALVVFCIAMAVGRAGAGVLGRRTTAIGLVRVSAVAVLVLLAVGCFAPWPRVALAAFMATGLAVSCLWPSTLAMAADRFPGGDASMFGLLSALGNIGCLIMPWVVGVTAALAEAHGGLAGPASLHWGMATVIACPVLMMVLLARMARHPSEPAGG
jgi:fucose permease